MDHKAFKNWKIILGSQSPRRKHLLSLSQLDFTVKAIEVNEDFPADIPVEELAEFLAHKKSKAHSNYIDEKTIVITADTVVTCDGIALAKASNLEENIKMLQLLSDKTHEVYTGVNLLSKHKQKRFTVKSLVTFAPISIEEATFYIKKDKPFDKAGGYGIQDWIGMYKIRSINGSYTNILGLPIVETMEALYDFVNSK